MDVTLIVELVKAGAAPAPAWPRLESDDELVTVGSSRPLEDAWRIGQKEMISWLGALHGLDRLDAYQLLTQISRAPLANVVDTNYSAVTKVSKAYLPRVEPYDGLHADLRARAAQL
jgi:acetamidase/formamidase